MLLHLVHDEKFVDGIIDFFERLSPLNNKFVLITDHAQTDSVYIRNNIIQHVFYKSGNYKKLVEDIYLYEAVFIHYLDFHKIRFVNAVTSGTRFVWMIWGADAYNLIPNYTIYDEFTKSVLKTVEESGSRKLIKSQFLAPLRKIKDFYKITETSRAISKIQYCTTVVPNEYKIFSDRLKLKATYLPFNYGIKDYFKFRFDNKEGESNIFIGNSSAPSCNHLAILKLLNRTNIGNRRVIVPLSYGSKKYSGEILKYGKDLLGNAFLPITEYLEFTEYVKLLSGCSVCFMNQYRQQGMGNNIMILWLGARLYMRTENPAYSYFKENGLLVFPLNDNFVSLEELSQEEKAHNKRIIEKLYDKKVMIEKAKNLLRIVTS